MCIKYAARIILGISLLAQSVSSNAEDLRVGVVSESVNKWPMWVAEDKAYFEEEGLSVEMILTGEAGVQINMLSSGELEIATHHHPCYQ
jgi:ABC-type nitrate/sulfonate/bicarbonate transport system substrate-binding protein